MLRHAGPRDAGCAKVPCEGVTAHNCRCYPLYSPFSGYNHAGDFCNHDAFYSILYREDHVFTP